MMRSSRQQFLGSDSDEVLEQIKVGIVGLGGGGSQIAQQLVYLGVGDIKYIDEDIIKDVNMNRTVGAVEADVGTATPKVLVANRLARAVRPSIRTKSLKEKWQDRAIDLRDRDVIFGCVDDLQTRSELEEFCRRFHIVYIDVGMRVMKVKDGYAITGQMIVSVPGHVCMRCIGFITDTALEENAKGYGDAGPAPQVIWPNGLLASAAVGAFTSLVAPWNSDIQPLYLEYDGNTGTLLQPYIPNEILVRRCPHFASPTSFGDPWMHELNTPPPIKTGNEQADAFTRDGCLRTGG